MLTIIKNVVIVVLLLGVSGYLVYRFFNWLFNVLDFAKKSLLSKILLMIPMAVLLLIMMFVIIFWILAIGKMIVSYW
jgi:hypothetical protein